MLFDEEFDEPKLLAELNVNVTLVLESLRVMFKAGNAVRFSEGLVDGQESMNGAASANTDSTESGVYRGKVKPHAKSHDGLDRHRRCRSKERPC